jgi:hypothetical protein
MTLSGAHVELLPIAATLVAAHIAEPFIETSGFPPATPRAIRSAPQPPSTSSTGSAQAAVGARKP